MKKPHEQYENESDIEYAIRLEMISEIDREIKQANLVLQLYAWVVMPLVFGVVITAIIVMIVG